MKRFDLLFGLSSVRLNTVDASGFTPHSRLLVVSEGVGGLARWADVQFGHLVADRLALADFAVRLAIHEFGAKLLELTVVVVALNAECGQDHENDDNDDLFDLHLMQTFLAISRMA